MTFRVSTYGDLSQLKNLWELAFHDTEDYIDNFFDSYASADKIFVAEENGEILAMTAWFGSNFHRDKEVYRFAYLYAVATHPDHEKKGIASKLLAFIYLNLKEQGFHGVTTVPATASLHNFFGRNGFQDYFTYHKTSLSHTTLRYNPQQKTQKLTATQYKFLRDAAFAHHQHLLSTDESDTEHSVFPYISLDVEGFAYQESVCELSEGGFYWIGVGDILNDTYNPNSPIDPADQRWAQGCLCTLERATPQSFLVKERIFWDPLTQRDSGVSIWQIVKKQGLNNTKPLDCRSPNTSLKPSPVNFGMIQWLTPPPEDWHPKLSKETGYLGLAFD